MALFVVVRCPFNHGIGQLKKTGPEGTPSMDLTSTKGFGYLLLHLQELQTFHSKYISILGSVFVKSGTCFGQEGLGLSVYHPDITSPVKVFEL